MSVEAADMATPKSRRGLILMSSLALLVVLGLGILWSAREPIARNFVDKALAERGVQGSYRITHFGFREQTLENVVIGDPVRPDLIARRIELRFGWSGFAPAVRAIRASGVRLRARFANGRLDLGQIDRLMPAPSGEPFTLPDIDVTLKDARVRMETPYGLVGMAIEGSGNLADGFNGQMAAVARTLRRGSCVAERPTAFVHIATIGRRSAFDGPVRMVSLRCDGFSIAKPQAAIDVALGEALDSWNGGARFVSGAVTADAGGVSGARGRLSFKGGAAATDARLRLAVTRLRFADPVPALDGTPLAPFAAEIRKATAAARRALDIDSALHVGLEDGRQIIRVAPLEISSKSGARLALTASGRDGVGWDLARNRLLLNGRLTMAGGGFPEAVLHLDDRSGSLHMRPWVVPGARLAVESLQFDPRRIWGRVTIDGPVADGRIEGLSLPIDGRYGGGGLVLNPGCSRISFASLAFAGMKIGPTAIPLCAAPGGLAVGGSISGLKLAGSQDGTPLSVTAGRVSYTVARPGFVVEALAVRLGESRLDMARLDGDSRGGRFTGASGKIGPVPLLLSGGSGQWSLADSTLRLTGRLDVDDADRDPRFYRLSSDDVVLTLRDGTIQANGTLRHPRTGRPVAGVRITHDLGRGAGRALLDVAELRFTPELQPEHLTRLTLGVVANVEGQVTGQGRIFWDQGGVRSDGDFSTDSINLAAAFGPVSRLSGKIHFSDLLNRTTPPGQEVLLGEVNPGVAVIDGIVRYRLLPGQMVQIESGRWPFSGGQLLLEPTALDFGRPSQRRLTFRVEAMDAALFVEQFEFKNISVSGIFDGVLPMIFDAEGGRIEGGRLVVRQGGGTVAYVGELSNANLGRFAGMAFDALKSIRYDNLAIELDGSLDGEIVSKVVFNGVNKAPVGEKRGMVKQFTNLPFRFNITIAAPFRSLINSAQSINDPRGLVQGALARERAAPEPVQPKSSEAVP